MRTLVFCTAYADDQPVWEERYRPWLDAVLAGFRTAEILLVDDGSQTLPGWPDMRVLTVDSLGDAYTVAGGSRVTLAHFRNRLGRAATLDFPGWHRSFCFAALYAEKHNFDRVIHIESDAYVISARARIYMAGFSNGWEAFNSEHYAMPESAIQVIAGEGLRTFAHFARQPYAALRGQQHEHAMPFTATAQPFKGDRHGEVSDTIEQIPADADYAAQVPTRRERGFYWFLPSHVPAPPPAETATLQFCKDGEGLSALRDGWSSPEPRHHWMIGTESTLILPQLSATGDAVLRLRVTPHVFGDLLRRQRLIVEVNGHLIREFTITLEAVLGCDIPALYLDRGARDLLRLIHPDAVAPFDLSPDTPDTRRLAVSLEWLQLAR